MGKVEGLNVRAKDLAACEAEPVQIRDGSYLRLDGLGESEFYLREIREDAEEGEGGKVLWV